MENQNNSVQCDSSIKELVKLLKGNCEVLSYEQKQDGKTLTVYTTVLLPAEIRTIKGTITASKE